VSFAAITLYVACQRVFIIVSVHFVLELVRKLLDTPSYERGSGRRMEKITQEELHTSYSSPNTFRLIKSKRMRLSVHVARIENEKCIQHIGWKT
jgi:hypothetical protein